MWLSGFLHYERLFHPAWKAWFVVSTVFFTVCWTNRAVSITCYLICGRTLLRINCVIHPFFKLPHVRTTRFKTSFVNYAIDHYLWFTVVLQRLMFNKCVNVFIVLYIVFALCSSVIVCFLIQPLDIIIHLLSIKLSWVELRVNPVNTEARWKVWRAVLF